MGRGSTWIRADNGSMFNDYRDITDRIAEAPKWWDEQRVPRYADFHPYRVADVYAREVALVEIACQACWRRFEVAVSSSGRRETPGDHGDLAECIEKGDLDYGDPPDYGECRVGPSMTCYELRVLQYWSRRNETLTWVRDSRFEIDLPELNVLAELVRLKE
jgi:hypothetical protein